jgi:hypothetical protein
VKQLGKIVAVNLAVLAVLLALIELGLRTVGMGPDSFFKYGRYFHEGYYPQNYHQAHPNRGFDIAPSVRDTPFQFEDATTTVFSNAIGCFDRNTADGLAAANYALLLGDSFAWGYASYEDKWGTLVEQNTQIPIAKCGVTATGQRHQLAKARDVVAALGRSPTLVIVGYFINDTENDQQFPSTTIFRGNMVELKGLFGAPEAELERALAARYEAWQSGQRSLRARVRSNSAAANAIWHVAKGARDLLRSAPGDPGYAVLRLEDYLPDGNFAAHGQALEALRDWSDRTGADLLVVLTPGKNVGAATYDGTKTFLDGIGVKFLDPVPAFLDSDGRPSANLFWKIDAHLNAEGNRLLANELSAAISDSWRQAVSD